MELHPYDVELPARISNSIENLDKMFYCQNGVFADDKLNVTQMMEFFLGRIKKNIRKKMLVSNIF